ncbi:E3 ubiquitin-protein ligase RNF4-like [Zingiber officinale]|uniref:RING-type domain-containing protein n=1 Tax=Zingiber officinale TaxID=94328 RepID=A0A8J5KYB1_ZINOF|nr:E3 ubiquitin-protein ligase RNF4-like [Zingiber officinale]KAG6503798.1 hypothetical protein ZIOFF_036122 [Zingiber officinale]
MNTIGPSMQITKRHKKNASDDKRDLNLDLRYSTKVENLLHEETPDCKHPFPSKTSFSSGSQQNYATGWQEKNSTLASDCLHSCVVDQVARSTTQLCKSVDDGVTVLNSPCEFPKRKNKMASGRQSGAPSTSATASTNTMQTAVYCPICTNPLFQPSTTTCGHIFCLRCIKAFIQDRKKCPTCTKKLKATDVHLIYLPARSSN